MKDLAIYIHYPFCKSKCPYCDFNSHVKDKILHDDFLQGYFNEIEFFALNSKNSKVKTIFFGGGTPSLMPIDFVQKILDKIAQNFSIYENCEITLEANPTSFEANKFLDLKKIGINRLSIGIQALNDVDLKFLGREHSSDEAINTLKKAGEIFDNFSFDLIYARPQQTIKEWQIELNKALQFQTKHLSLYQLTIEKGTKFYSDFLKNKFIMPSPDLSAQFYEITNDVMQNNNYNHYEISNYAKDNFECKHNLIYWQGVDYIGIGAGAHSRIFLNDDKNRSAIMMIHDPDLWLKKAKEKNGIQTIDKITQIELIEELILMGLRLEKGIENKLFKEICKKDFNEIFNLEKLKKLENLGLLEISHNNIKIPPSKRILSNNIIAKVCGAMK